MGECWTKGPVPFDGQACVSREFEDKVFSAVTSGDWVLLLGPGQHGKTTGIMRIGRRLEQSGYKVARITLEELPPCRTYGALMLAIGRLIRRSWNDNGSEKPTDSDKEYFLAWLRVICQDVTEPVVLIIDEAASINTEFRSAFYGQIRQIKSEMATAQRPGIESRLSFVFSGTFKPEALVETQNSPFNVSQTVQTDDLTLDQAHELAATVDSVLEPHVDAIYGFVGGQPFLLQAMFKEILSRTEPGAESTLADVLGSFPGLVGDHLQSLFRKVIEDKDLTAMTAELVQRGHLPLLPADSNQAYLENVGLVRKVGARLVFRNELYCCIARQQRQFALTTGAPTAFLISGFDNAYFTFMKNAALKEVASSACRAAAALNNAGHFRLALVGFGAATEAILLDLLVGIPEAELGRAVEDANTESTPAYQARWTSRENRRSPRTWRFENMINVVRQLQSSDTKLDPSHAIRLWRNLVHPARAAKSFPDEAQLRGESVQAGGMIASLKRDICLHLGVSE